MRRVAPEKLASRNGTGGSEASPRVLAVVSDQTVFQPLRGAVERAGIFRLPAGINERVEDVRCHVKHLAKAAAALPSYCKE